MIQGWRLVKTRYASTAFDGEGARRYGARWNPPGTRVAYASDSVALATLEVLVQLGSSATLAAYSLASLQFPDALVEALEDSALPKNWRHFPAPPSTQSVGTRWVKEARSAVLRVPSAIIPSAHNFLLNPLHPDFAKVIIDPPRTFEFDPRLLERHP